MHFYCVNLGFWDWKVTILDHIPKMAILLSSHLSLGIKSK